MATVKRLDFNREKQLLINLITNSDYCKAVLPYLNKEYFKSKHVHVIIDWVRAYYETYHVAPKGQITDIFEQYSASMDDDVREQVGTILSYLSDMNENGVENHNTDFLVDTAHDLLHGRHVALQYEVAGRYLEEGKVDEASKALSTAFEVKKQTSKWKSFHDIELTRQTVRKMVEKEDIDKAFFAFQGRLGNFIGPIERGWLVAFLAPAKRGKTTYMMESVICGIMRKLNVVIVSLEMPVEQLFERFLLSVLGDRPEAGERNVMMPIMDCKSNQDGNCDLSERTGIGMIMDSVGNLESFEEAPDWEVCTACRGKSHFIPAGWKVPVPKKQYTEGEFIKKAEKFAKLYGKFCRAVHIPSKTATVRQIRDEVDFLIDDHGFVPDMIVLDYGDLILPERPGQKREELDEIWEGLRSWGQEDKVLLVTASQTNRLSADAEYVKDTHVAEDYSKIAKLDIGIGLCQNDAMKEQGLMNLNKVAHRHKEYIQSHVCTVLQELSLQQAVLDSEFIVK